MAENSNITWTTHTFNPWIGCTKVGPGCDNCYAETWDQRSEGDRWGPKAARTKTRPGNWSKPVTWNHKAILAGVRERVFVASLADVFDNHASIEDEWRLELAALILKCQQLDWLLLSKRAGNVSRYLKLMFPEGVPSNVIVGSTVANQEDADRDIPKLLKAKAVSGISRVFLSMEPLVGPVQLTSLGETGLNALDGRSGPSIDWVITGGESGAFARLMRKEWVTSLRDQCVAAGTAFHFKQWGEYLAADEYRSEMGEAKPAPIEGYIFVGVDAAGRELDGRTWDDPPPHLW